MGLGGCYTTSNGGTRVMSVSLTIYGRKHYWWKYGSDAWFYRPDEHSSGGTGFKLQLLFIAVHACFMWGHH